MANRLVTTPPGLPGRLRRLGGAARPETKLDPVHSFRCPNGSKESVGAKDRCGLSIDRGPPARIVDLVKQDITVPAQPGFETDPVSGNIELLKRKLTGLLGCVSGSRTSQSE